MVLTEMDHILVDPAIKAYKESGNRTFSFRLSNDKLLTAALTRAKKLYIDGYICDVSPELFDVSNRSGKLLQKYQFTITDKLIQECEWDI